MASSETPNGILAPQTVDGQDGLGFTAGIDAADLLTSRDILDGVDLTDVPANARLVKGVLECKEKTIPLLDARVRLNAGGNRPDAGACALIVALGRSEVGLILDNEAIA